MSPPDSTAKYCYDASDINKLIFLYVNTKFHSYLHCISRLFCVHLFFHLFYSNILKDLMILKQVPEVISYNETDVKRSVGGAGEFNVVL